MDAVARKHPDWIKVRAPTSPEYLRTRAMLGEFELHSVCQEACCPNIGECLLPSHCHLHADGRRCTRNCPYCAVSHGRARPLDPDEPRRIADAVARLGLQHVVVTSVDRDDLPDGGAAHFAATASAIKVAIALRRESKCWCPTSRASTRASRPSSIPRSTFTTTISRPCRGSIRPLPSGGRYERSLDVLDHAGKLRRAAETRLLTKAGLMLGLGEADATS